MDSSIDKIPLEGLYNTRDLGGIETIDGKHIKHHRLIRSGVLTNATPHDQEVLLEEYNLRLIVDLRNGIEISQTPDVYFPTVKIILNPIMQDPGNAIIHSKSPNINRVETLLGSFKSKGLTPEEYMMGLYSDMVSSKYSQDQIGKFLKIIINHEHGSTLWHCNEGKDRTGVCTAILLSCLGVSRQTVIDDFHITGHFMHEKFKSEIKKYHQEVNMTPELEDVLRTILTAKESYILSVFSSIDLYYGGFDTFRRDFLNISDDEIVKLKETYLE
jgi:protein-tyrosine phosphatase